MLPILRKAHTNLDTAVDSLYCPHPFVDDRERAEHLLGRSERLSAPLFAAAQSRPTRTRKTG